MFDASGIKEIMLSKTNGPRQAGKAYIPYVPWILGQLLDLISLANINISEPRFESYDPWDMTN